MNNLSCCSLSLSLSFSVSLSLSPPSTPSLILGAGFYYVALAVVEPSMQTRLAQNSQGSSCLSLPSTGIKCMCPAAPSSFFKTICKEIKVERGYCSHVLLTLQRLGAGAVGQAGDQSGQHKMYPLSKKPYKSWHFGGNLQMCHWSMLIVVFPSSNTPSPLRGN